MSDVTRRTFLGQSAALASLALSSSAVSAASGERPVIALIGCGGMGNQHLKLLAPRTDLHLKYLCDCDSQRLEKSAALVTEAGGKAPQLVSDFRRVLEDPAIDAVWIATPDHWHVPAALLALAAGKHVYVEKPCSHNVREGRLLLDAARAAKKVVQVGTQSRSTAHVQAAIRALRDGAIGDVLVAKAWNSQLRGNIGKTQPTEPPRELDYRLWLGPAPYRPYRSNLLPAVWRFWRDFGAGDIGNDGVHEIDIARWGLGVHTHPTAVSGIGTKLFFDDDQEFPDTYYSVFEYAAGQTGDPTRQLIYEQRDWSPYHQEGAENGNAFYGTKGVLILRKSTGYQVLGPRNRLISEGSGSPDLGAHHQNFLDCIRTGERPAADIEEGHLSATLCHLANISTRLRQTLAFDPLREQFVDNPEADASLQRTYEPGHWAIPVGA